MLSLIPPTFGNRRPDGDGNTHTRHDGWGNLVVADKGRYVGRHRRPDFAESFLGLPAGTYNKVFSVMAVLIGDRRV